jgi:ABC-2 type transport system permease protein
MRLIRAHARAELLELLRYPSFSVPTLLFPALLFLFFGVPSEGSDEAILMVSYAAFGVLGVALFQFGVGVASERASPWQVYLRTLPAPAHVRFAARLVAAAVFALGSAGAVVAVALALTSADLGAEQWLRVGVALAYGTVPFGLLGLAIGYWLTPKGAVPVANILFLGLAFLGGLWTGAASLPAGVDSFSPLLPTRQWGEIVWAPALGRGWELWPWLGLAAYAAGFGALASWGYRRDEGQRYQ